MTRVDVIVIGGGAAGLMCAITAARRGRRVLVLEGSNKVGKKILMSGGGRCNFTNLHCEPDRFISGNPRFCISALSRYTQRDFITLVEKHGIAYHEKTAGQLFCDGSSREIVTMLLDECEKAGVKIRTHCKIDSVRNEGQYRVSSNLGRFISDSLVVATGGLSIPKMGASGFGYELARQFGHAVIATRAGLVPFTFSGAMHEMMGRLTGISCRAALSTPAAEFTDDILFTHRGLSGPAVLQLSSYWIPGTEVLIDLLPDRDAGQFLLGAKRAQPRSLLRTVLGAVLPRALVSELQTLFWHPFAELPLSGIGDDVLKDVAQRLSRWSVKPAATEGYRTAEVTIGGVDTADLSSKTMESAHQARLYFVGEVVDVTGHLGGFNFQWAWSSGWAAGHSV